MSSRPRYVQHKAIVADKARVDESFHRELGQGLRERESPGSSRSTAAPRKASAISSAFAPANSGHVTGQPHSVTRVADFMRRSALFPQCLAFAKLVGHVWLKQLQLTEEDASVDRNFRLVHSVHIFGQAQATKSRTPSTAVTSGSTRAGGMSFVGY